MESKKLISGIYKITNPIEEIYIGQSENLKKRKGEYRRIYPIKGQPKIYESLIKYGWENHIWEIQEYCSIEDLNRRERYWQDFYDVLNGLNCILKETNEKRAVITQEIRDKMSKVHMGQNNPFYGKKHTKETLQRIAEASTGRVKTEETKQKISKANSNKSHKGNWEKARLKTFLEKEITFKIVLQYDLNGNFIREFRSANSADRYYNISLGAVSKCCRGIVKTVKGFKWKYKEKDE